jgi:penicillin-binding protein 1A
MAAMHRRFPALVVALAALVSSCAYRYETDDLVAEAPPPVAQSSFMYDAQGRQILLLRADENRVYKRIAEIPQVLRDAVVAIEDERFYLHKGVDLKGLIRSARTNVSEGSVSQGASTITQQYVGNVYLDRQDKSAKRKLQEIALARQFEQKYTKDYILELYLNWVYLGNGSSGVQQAAKGYFNKDVADITLPEAALIAGLIQLPGRLDPYLSSESFEAAKARRNQVLERMRVNEMISDQQYAEAVQAPLVLKPYVPVAQETYPAPHFVEEVKKWFLANPRFGATQSEREKLLFQGGLRIYTTVDLDLQRAAEDARNSVLPAIDGLDAAIVTTDPANGNVLAMVGGKNYFGTSTFAKVNLAAGDGRQTGSSVKPIGLAAALAGGISLAATYPAPPTIELPLPGLQEPWNVKGGGPEGGDPVTLIEATEKSYNTVYAQLSLEQGPEKFVAMAAKLGITHKIEPVAANILGTENITMLEMSTAFGTFATRGVRRDPVLVTKIVNADGTTLFEHPYSQTKAIEASIADQINYVLQGAVNQGTGTAARIPGRQVAGKTGSAENNADATFVGYTPNRVTAVWVGFPEGQVPMVPPRTPVTVFGGTYPARIFQKVMTVATARLPAAEFVAPSSIPTTTSTTIAGPATPVPDVRGTTVAVAQARLTAAGFTVNAVNVETAEFAAGTVINQAPRGGTTAPQGSKVTIEVAATPKTSNATVPNVVGQSRASARSQLIAAGFTVLELFEPAPAGTTPAPVSGNVWRQTPSAGSRKPADGVVQLSVQP